MITTIQLNELAKAYNNESYVIPSFTAYSSSLASVSASDTTLSGEIGARASASRVRSGGSPTVTVTSIRSGALSSSAGDTLTGVALLSSSSGGSLLAEFVISSILHTTSYDVQTDITITFSGSS
jgi:hypothetical protein